MSLTLTVTSITTPAMSSSSIGHRTEAIKFSWVFIWVAHTLANKRSNRFIAMSSIKTWHRLTDVIYFYRCSNQCDRFDRLKFVWIELIPKSEITWLRLTTTPRWWNRLSSNMRLDGEITMQPAEHNSRAELSRAAPRFYHKILIFIICCRLRCECQTLNARSANSFCLQHASNVKKRNEKKTANKQKMKRKFEKNWQTVKDGVGSRTSACTRFQCGSFRFHSFFRATKHVLSNAMHSTFKE